MSVLSDQFAGFPDFVDFRQDQLMDVLRAVRTLRNMDSEDPSDLIRTLATLDLPRVHRMYQNKCNELRRGNYSIASAIQGASVSFTRFRAVLGADDYV